MDPAPQSRWRAVRQWSREGVLLLVMVALAVMFVVTGLAAGYYHAEQAQLAAEWFARGDQALKSEHPRKAIEDLRNALSYAPDEPAYQLRLAQALTAANRLDEAESYLLELWARRPGDGEINLELARLEAAKKGVDAARYYDNAIYGVWDTEPDERRWQTRMELFQYWRARGNLGQAQAELLAMAAVTPDDDYQRQTLIGQLELAAGNPRQALTQFQAALRANRRWPPALLGAGEAEYAVGDYRRAIPYLESAVRLERENKQAAQQLLVARLVLSSDPFVIGLGQKERIERTQAAFEQAKAELSACAYEHAVDLEVPAPQNELRLAWARGNQLEPLLRRLSRHPDNMFQAMNFVFSVENLAAASCGPLQGKDEALWLIAKQHQLAGTSLEPAR